MEQLNGASVDQAANTFPERQTIVDDGVAASLTLSALGNGFEKLLLHDITTVHEEQLDLLKCDPWWRARGCNRRWAVHVA